MLASISADTADRFAGLNDRITSTPARVPARVPPARLALGKNVRILAARSGYDGRVLGVCAASLYRQVHGCFLARRE